MKKSSTTTRITCPHCGTVLESDEPITNTSVECPACGEAFTPALDNSKPKWWKHPKKLWIVAGGLVLLALLFGVGKPSGGLGGKSGKVQPTLSFRSETEHVRKFGGRATTGKYTFSPHEHMFDFHELKDASEVSFLGHRRIPINLFDFTSPPMRPWNLYDSGMDSPPRAWIWEREDGYYLENHPKHTECMKYVQPREQTRLQQSALMPAPVLVSYGQVVGYGICYLYLNEAGDPSVLEWNRYGETDFVCHEGGKDLTAYVNSLRELRGNLVKYTENAKKNKLGEYSEVIKTKSKPAIYIGDLVKGTRERAELEYSFEVKPDGRAGSTNTTFILERWKSNGRTKGVFMDLETIDKRISQFEMFESKKSIEAAFEPLYAFLTWRRSQ